MAIVWKINGTAVADLGIENLRLRLRSLRPDELLFDIPTAAFDSAPAFANAASITLTRTVDADPAVTWFKGLIVKTPRSADPRFERVGYVALGPWYILDELPYLQNFKTPADASDAASSLIDYLRGRTILHQSAAGAKITVGEFLNDVIDYVVAAESGTMQRPDYSAVTGLDVTAPWDEVTDQMCSDAIVRALQQLPDAVAWWDYTTTPPTLNFGRRANLSAQVEHLIPSSVTATCVAAATGNVDLGTNASSIMDGVTLVSGDRVLLASQTAPAQNGIYTFHSTSAPLSRATEADTAAEVNAAKVLVTGGSAAGKYFVQSAAVATLDTDAVSFEEVASRVEAIPEILERHDLKKDGVVLIYLRTHRSNDATWETYEIDDAPDGCNPAARAALVRTIELAGAVYDRTFVQQKVNVDTVPSALVFTGGKKSADAGFSDLLTWWKAHAPELRESAIVVKQFIAGTRTKADGSAFTTAAARELISGAVTDWMIDRQGIVVEDQLVKVTVVVEYTDPVTSKKSMVRRQLSATIRATSAQTRTYSFTTESSYTPQEATPVGLAAAILESVSALHYEGEIALIEAECSTPQFIGKVLNVLGGLAAWRTMNAVIQAAELQIEEGRSLLTFGPPKQIGFDDMVALYRANRQRRVVTSYQTRTTGKTGSTNAKQGLSLWHPAPALTASARTEPRVFTDTLTPAGDEPTQIEVIVAIEYLYDAATFKTPIEGDTVLLTAPGGVQYNYRITANTLTSTDLKIVPLLIDGVSYYGVLASGAGAAKPRSMTGTLSPAGLVPTQIEVIVAIEYIYSVEGFTTAVEGDTVLLNVSGVPKLSYRITAETLTSSNLAVVPLIIGSTSYYGVLSQTGIY